MMSTPAKRESRRTAIVLLNWNNWEDTIACIDSLLRGESQDFVVVVCDNGSTDESWNRISTWCRQRVGSAFAVWSPGSNWHIQQQVVLIQTGSNLGFAGGCNVGIRFALQQTQCNYIWLLNNDTVVDSASLTHQVRRMDEDPGIGLLGSTLVYDTQDRMVQCFGGYGFNFWTGRVRPFPFAPNVTQTPTAQQVEERIRYVSGASTFASRSFIEQVGLLNEQYFLYFEEIDWAVRGKRFRLSFCPESIVLHKEGRSIGSSSSASQRSRQSELWLTRNRVLFTRTYFKGRLPIAVLWILAVALVRGCKCGLTQAAILVRGLWSGLRAPILPLPQLCEWPDTTLGTSQGQPFPEPNGEAPRGQSQDRLQPNPSVAA